MRKPRRPPAAFRTKGLKFTRHLNNIVLIWMRHGHFRESRWSATNVKVVDDSVSQRNVLFHGDAVGNR